MFQLSSINPVWIKLIKVISPILMSCAIVLDIAIAYRWLHAVEIPQGYMTLGAIGSVALGAHFLEGIIAGVMAWQRQRNPFFFGVYTFFVGTVAFLELREIQ